ncbi:hypothetical protein A0256_21000 [Mucilaginibacter sp. PAMC 26640]|nr:hypothetical protein A0256_21000 [Mucilaginibacter sp. PAMC 26640]
MLAALGKYLRQNLLGVAVGLAIVSFLVETLLIHSKDFLFTGFAAVLIFIIAGYQKHHERRLKARELKKKGLTITDTLNIEFVKSWEVLRKQGIYKFCFIDGGLMLGLIIMLPVALIGMLTLSDLNGLFSDPGRIFWYITDCALIGYVTGALIYFVRWIINEKRFIRLTDPLAF